MRSKRPYLGSDRPDLGFDRSNLGSERSGLWSERPCLRLQGRGTDGHTDGRKPENLPYVES